MKWILCVVLLVFVGCKEEARPECLDFGDKPKAPSNPEKCVPPEF